MTDITGQVLCERYHVGPRVGCGGMADVYRVWDKGSQTYRALKLLHEEYAHDVILLRHFQREAEFLCKLDHPNIVRFYGLETQGAMTFMLMEFVNGKTLKSEIHEYQGRGFSIEQVIRTMRPICSALYHAHQKRLVHNDVKPGNIMRSVEGTIKLTDFGISRIAGTAMTSMVTAGSPPYMAPEQIRGYVPTAQVDIYALGIMLFEMLSGGELPFTGDHAPIEAITKEKIQWEHLNLAPPSIRNYRPDAPSAVDQVIMQCLAKSLQDRYPDCIVFMKDLEAAAKITGKTAGRSKKHPDNKPEPVTIVVSDSPSTSPPIKRNTPPPPKKRPNAPSLSRNFLALVAGLLVLFIAILGLKVMETRLGTPTLSSVSTLTNPRLTKVMQECVAVDLSNTNQVDECITAIEVMDNGELLFNISWTAHLDGNFDVKMTPSKKIVLVDDLGNQYDFLEAGGGADTEQLIYNGSIVTGWLRFPAIHADAQAVKFVDMDNQVQTKPIERFWP